MIKVAKTTYVYISVYIYTDIYKCTGMYKITRFNLSYHPGQGLDRWRKVGPDSGGWDAGSLEGWFVGELLSVWTGKFV